MPDNKGWRKKKLPKELAPSRPRNDQVTAPIDLADQRRPHGWRRTISASRPQTPVSVASGPSIPGDADDATSERSEPTPRRDSKPKLARYASLFSGLKEANKGPEFAEPWSEDAPPSFEPYVDPLHAIQSVRSHMNGMPSTPIPPSYNNALFRVFADYGRLREEKERLQRLTQELIHDWTKSEKQRRTNEADYKSEIRRLELSIARGTRGMAGLMNLRQGSLLERQKRQRRAVSTDRLDRTYRLMSPDQLDGDIKARSQEVRLRRPISPSEPMAALSRQFTDNGTVLSIGTPPSGNRMSTLSRKFRSELDLAKAIKLQSSKTTPDVHPAGVNQSSDITELAPSHESPLELVESPVECEAFIALRQLGVLVAKRRGLNVENFLEALMELLSPSHRFRFDDDRGSRERSWSNKSEPGANYRKGCPQSDGLAIKRPAPRNLQSSSRSDFDLRSRRHFSFELGDDELLLPGGSIETPPPESPTGPSELLTRTELRQHTLQNLSSVSTPSSQTLSTDLQKPSKIPSPVFGLGRARRESSVNSLPSAVSGMAESRRGSRTSAITAYQHNSNRRSKHASRSRSASTQVSLAVDSSTPVRGEANMFRSEEGSLAMVAAKVASNRATLQADNSPVRHAGRSTYRTVVSEKPKVTTTDPPSGSE